VIDLRRVLATEFGLKVNTIEGNDAGVDRSAQRFRVHADDPRTGSGWFAVKWSTGGSTAGLLVPSALAAASVAGVPGPRLARDGRPWADQRAGGDVGRLSVVPWVGARQALAGGLSEAQWRAFGRLLAAVHSYRPTGGISAALPPVSHTSELAAVARTDALVGDDRDGPQDATAALWREHRGRIRAAAEAVPRLAGHITPAVLCHADPHLGNVLAPKTGAAADGDGGGGDDDSSVWLVDWDDAVLATPELDLMFVLGATYGSEWIGDRERTWFARGYLDSGASTAGDLVRAANPARLQYYRLVRALIDVADLTSEAVLPPTEPSARSAASRFVAAELASTGLLALAGY
jgi:spectinomycin phosphotransferase